LGYRNQHSLGQKYSPEKKNQNYKKGTKSSIGKTNHDNRGNKNFAIHENKS
jgi:hypothetical protein